MQRVVGCQRDWLRHVVVAAQLDGEDAHLVDLAQIPAGDHRVHADAWWPARGTAGQQAADARDDVAPPVGIVARRPVVVVGCWVGRIERHGHGVDAEADDPGGYVWLVQPDSVGAQRHFNAVVLDRLYDVQDGRPDQWLAADQKYPPHRGAGERYA